MPVTEIPLDSSTREEDVTILHGRNLLLKLIEREDRKQLLLGENARMLLSTDDLCYKGFREIIERMLEIENRTESNLEASVREGEYFLERQMFLARRLGASGRPPKVGVGGKVASSLKRSMDATMKSIQRRDSEVLALEEQLKKFNRELDVLEPVALLRCPRCGTPVLKGSEGRRPPGHIVPALTRHELRRDSIIKGEIKGSVKCSVCGESFGRAEASRSHLHFVRENIRRLWKEGIWFEDYMSRLLRAQDWKTWSSVYVLGSSGVRHEIDVLGVKEDYVLICECKTGHVDRAQVFNFWAKVYDIRAHVSMLALIGALPEPETKEFLSKNPSVSLLEGLGNKRKKEIVEELKGSVVGKI